jgi:hypothetical protein
METTPPSNPSEVCAVGNLTEADLVDAAADVVKAVLELEASLREGMLAERLAKPGLAAVMGKSLVERYSEIAARNLQHDHEYRRNWIELFTQAFQICLQPAQSCFDACVGPLDGRIPTLLARHPQGGVLLREEQTVSVRRWGIGFQFANPTEAGGYERHLLRVALSKLESNICSLRFLESTYLAGKSKLPSKAKYNHDGLGKRFEHLMYDVLNEHKQHARFATLAEDVLERTDLRVSYPGLERKGGARIQVSLVADPDRHSAKVGALLLPDEFIHLTPLDLASCAITPPAVMAFEGFDWMEFWAALGEKYDDSVKMASDLYALFVDALSFSRLHPHPLGPLWILPPPLRSFIRIFTEHWAQVTTACVRRRENTSGRWRGSINRFKGKNRAAKRSGGADSA